MSKPACPWTLAEHHWLLKAGRNTEKEDAIALIGRRAYWLACGADKEIDAVVRVVHGPVHYENATLQLRSGSDIANADAHRIWFTKGTDFSGETRVPFCRIGRTSRNRDGSPCCLAGTVSTNQVLAIRRPVVVVLNSDAVEAACFRSDLLDRRRELMHRWSRWPQRRRHENRPTGPSARSGLIPIPTTGA